MIVQQQQHPGGQQHPILWNFVFGKPEIKICPFFCGNEELTGCVSGSILGSKWKAFIKN